MRCLEFYSGIGGAHVRISARLATDLFAKAVMFPAGMHYAVQQSCLDIEVICAFDINTVANDVYQFNHSRRPYQVTGASAKLWVDLATEAVQWQARFL